MYKLLRLEYARHKTLKAYRADWRTLPIKECGEPLVMVSGNYCLPYYADKLKLIDDRRIFLRESVYHAFLHARESLARQGRGRFGSYACRPDPGCANATALPAHSITESSTQAHRQTALVATDTEEHARALASAHDPFGRYWMSEMQYSCDFIDSPETHVVGDIVFKSLPG